MRTNCKQVSMMIQKHINEYYTVEELKEQVSVFTYLPTTYHAIIEMVQGGCFLIYYEEVKDFLNSLGINPSNKEYDDQKSWDLYKHLIAREGVKMIGKDVK